MIRFAAFSIAVLVTACRGQPDGTDDRPADAEPAEASASPTHPPGEPESPHLEDRAPRTGPPLRNDGTIFADTEMMGTRVSINVHVGAQGEAAAAGAAVEAAFDEMARIEGLLSEWRPNSELSRLNRAAGGEPMKVSPELRDILVRSRTISEETDGSFDVTFHAVGQLWSFTPGATPPDAVDIQRKLPLVGWRGIEVDQEAGTARLAREGMMVGLGAIGKGYAAERASAVLHAKGWPNHVVEAGGDTFASGTKDGQPWMVGVQNPDGAGVIGVLPASDRAVVTSGDYQRFFEHEGRRYAHILDPRTGWPIELERSPKSVTLVTSSPTEGDAYCTAVVVMGAEKGLRFVESRSDLDAIIVTRTGEIKVSSGLQDQLIRTTAGGKPLSHPQKMKPAPAPKKISE
jgi:FAD:protein FMN transferase